MNNKQNIDEICRIVKDECDRIIVANDQEEVYQCIDGILELLPLLLKATYAKDEKTVDIEPDSGTIEEQNEDGGAGSGNWGHKGVPGQLGGSAPGGGEHNRSGSNGDYTSEAKRAEFSKKLKAEKEEVLSMKANKQALFLKKQNFLSNEDAKKAMLDGSVSGKVEEYYDFLEKNGDPTPAKKLSGQVDGELRKRVDNGEFDGYMEAREAYIKDWAGVDTGEARKVNYELQTWFGGKWSAADTETLDSYIEKDHAYEGTIYRGLHFERQSDYDDFMSKVDADGFVKMKGNSSWSSDEETARGFAHTVNPDVNSVVIVCVANRTSAPVAHISTQGEDEVLAHSKARWNILRKEHFDLGDGIKNTTLYVMESGEYDD